MSTQRKFKKMKFAIRAQNLEYKLTETEENIVEYILAHQAEVVNMKIVTLAEHFFTVPNTITRFCRKLGYGGFTELKVELRHELLEKQAGNQQLALIEENFGLVDEKREIKLAKLLQKARLVNFYAQDQTHLIAELGVECFQVLDSKFQLLGYEKEVLSRINNGAGDVFFFISISGETPAIVNLAKKAKERGHQVVSLTNLSNNSLAAIADVAIYCLTEVTYIAGIEVTDKTPMFVILQSLFQRYLKLCKITPKKPETL